MVVSLLRDAEAALLLADFQVMERGDEQAVSVDG